MSTELATRSVSLPAIDGVEVGTNYLRISDNISAQAVAQLEKSLLSIESAHNWWVGDYIQAKARPELSGVLQMELAIEIPSERYHKTASFFDVENRIPELSYQHHEEAMLLCKTPAEALALLHEAATEGWTVSQMRKVQRKRSAEYTDDKGGDAMHYSQVTNFARWCDQQLRSGSFRKQQAEAILSDLQPVIKLVRALESIAGHCQPNVEGGEFIDVPEVGR